MTPNHWHTHWPIMLGTVIIAASCALLKSPSDLTADNDLGALYDQGVFREPDGSITDGGTVSGSWEGSCEMYGYPYLMELTLTDSAGDISGTGRWITSWGEFTGTVVGERDPSGVEMDFMVDYYGYDYAIVMDADFDGLTLTGNCDVFYSAGGFLDLERV
jgi:hypothetical protein